ncbi:MAG: CehA/McbA family metallohydrolase [Planctomycetes bacterium]|nr:CehA/McbA family metallohydrolase [Planctomycetota bacterium]
MLRLRFFLCGAVVLAPALIAAGEELPLVSGIDAQPLKAQVKRVVEALETLGEPLSARRQAALQEAIQTADDDKAVEGIQKVLDELCLAGVSINPESRVKAQPGPAPKELVENGWRVFLIKVHNEAGVTAPLGVVSPNAAPLVKRSTGSPDPKLEITPTEAQNRWLDIDVLQNQPLTPTLSGLELDYRVVSLYSRDRGKREATLAFDVGQGTQDLGFRSETPILFECRPAVEVTLDVIDHDGQPTTAWFILRDGRGRVYPARTRRLAPDFFFHDQIYRHNGESVLLPPGEFEVTFGRGPEYRIQKTTVLVPEEAKHRESFRLERWIKLTEFGWYSGDHHVHAAGCSHYEAPTQGVTPEAMMRHILGEDLNVGCVLSWGPCWYHQKQFFEGSVHKLSTKDYVMRYDVEVSGFPSQHAGHLCLLGLTEDDYEYPEPVEFDWQFGGRSGRFKGTKSDEIGQWPTWDLPILKWGKEQGAVVGFSHSGWGLALPDYGPGGERIPLVNRRPPRGAESRAADTLPDYAMPAFDGIGANEFVVDTVHGVCDFISAVDTPAVWELNVWYHTLNCGFTTRISGETDFPCIYGDRVGLGRVYVKLDPDKARLQLDYDSWVEGLRDGRSYCCDGLSHLIDFSANGLGVGEEGDGGRPSFLAVDSGEKVSVKVDAAAFLNEEPESWNGRPIKDIRLDQKPYWHVERARIEGTRKVPVELIVNGQPVERKEIIADGEVNELTFEHTPERSSWIAVRIFPSSHTNPVFVEVDGKPIRASRRSAEWCAEAVDVCWSSKKGNTRESEREAAKAAYDHAKATYERIAQEAFDD